MFGSFEMLPKSFKFTNFLGSVPGLSEYLQTAANVQICKRRHLLNFKCCNFFVLTKQSSNIAEQNKFYILCAHIRVHKFAKHTLTRKNTSTLTLLRAKAD